MRIIKRQTFLCNYLHNLTIAWNVINGFILYSSAVSKFLADVTCCHVGTPLALQTLSRIYCFRLQHTSPFPTATNLENKKGEKEFFISFITLTLILVVSQWVVGAIYKSQSPYAPSGFMIYKVWLNRNYVLSFVKFGMN